MDTVTSVEPAIRANAPAVPEARSSRPAVAWAVLGVVFIIIEVVAFAGWIGSGDAQRVSTGADPVPTYTLVAARLLEVAAAIALPVFLYYFLIRPWRKEGRITTDGLLCLVWFTLPWQDALLNYFQPWFTYNSVFFNLGHWNPHIPGWLSRNGELVPEPLIFIFPMYVVGEFGMCILGCHLMRKIRVRWPQMGTAGLLGIMVVFFALVDVVVDPLGMLLGLWSYSGGISWLTIFHGHHYQYPVYEGLMVGVWWTTMTAFRYFTNDKGETIGERGLDKVRLTGGRKTVVRFLALTGALNVAFLSYSIPAAISGLYASPWPDDVTTKSYFNNGICGGRADTACPGPAVPIPRQPDSAYLSPDGKLVVPEGTKLP